MSKYKNSYRNEVEDTETYSEAFMKQNATREADTDDDNLPDPKSPEEATFKKRYSDLRRLSQSQSSKIQELENKINDLSKNATGAKLPKTEQEVEAWMKKYPDASAFIDTIARKRASEMASEFQTTSSKLAELQSDIAKERAFGKLLKKHPDFEEIRQSEQFNDWINERYERNENDWVWNALFENDTDVDLASEAIQYFKDKTDYGSKRRKATKETAKNVPVRSERTEPSAHSETKFSESQIERESRKNPKWYEENEAAIVEAMKKGEIEMDISGGAR